MWKFWVVEGEVEGFLIRLEFRLCHFQMPHGTRTPPPPLDPCRLSIEWLPMQICSLAAKRLAVYIYELSFTS